MNKKTVHYMIFFTMIFFFLRVVIARGQVLEIESGPERTTFNNTINNN